MPAVSTLPCPDCGDPAEVAPLAEVAMEERDVLVRIQGLVRTTCPRGHRSVGPVDAGARATAVVHDLLLTAGTRGLLRRHPVCGQCGADLVLLPRVTDTPVPMELDGRVVTPIVEAPMSRCPDCGREQLTGETAERVDRVLAAAVASADEPAP